MEKKSLRVIGYIRVSTDDQAESGAGLAAQTVAIETACDYRGYELVRIATDTGSGKSMDRKHRPGLAGALDELDAGEADMLMASKLDRIARSVAGFANLMDQSRARGWSLSFLDLDVDTSTPNGKMIANLMSNLAEWEREIIGQRTRDALAAKKAAGVILGRPRTLDPAVRSRILAERADGRSLRAIATTLTAEGVPTARGGSHWHASSIRQIATSKAREAAA